jgi:hypothetical protein
MRLWSNRLLWFFLPGLLLLLLTTPLASQELQTERQYQMPNFDLSEYLPLIKETLSKGGTLSYDPEAQTLTVRDDEAHHLKIIAILGELKMAGRYPIKALNMTVSLHKAGAKGAKKLTSFTWKKLDAQFSQSILSAEQAQIIMTDRRLFPVVSKKPMQVLNGKMARIQLTGLKKEPIFLDMSIQTLPIGVQGTLQPGSTAPGKLAGSFAYLRSSFQLKKGEVLVVTKNTPPKSPPPDIFEFLLITFSNW